MDYSILFYSILFIVYTVCNNMGGGGFPRRSIRRAVLARGEFGESNPVVAAAVSGGRATGLLYYSRSLTLPYSETRGYPSPPPRME